MRQKRAPRRRSGIRPTTGTPRLGEQRTARGPAAARGDRHDQFVTQLGEAIVAAARQNHTPTSSPSGAMPGPREVARAPKRSARELAQLGASIERERRIEAGRRARRLPYTATAATAIAGYSAWGAAELAQASLGPAGHAGAVAASAGLCALGLSAARVAFRHGITAGWAPRWWAAAASATGWVCAAAAVGPASWPMTAALGVGASALSSSWLRAHAVPEVSDMPTPTPLPEPEDNSEGDLGEVLARRWSENVARKGGAIPGALLTDRADLPNAIRWSVQLPPGESGFDRLLAQRARIASGLQQGQTRVIFEPVTEDESAARLTVITRDVLADGVPYPGPRYLSERARDGRIPVGPYADGHGQDCYIAVDQVGCRNGLATGAPGSGKSAFLEAVTLGYLASGRWLTLFGDGDPGGGSSPLLARIAYWPAAGADEVLAQLEAIEEELEVRTALKATLTPDDNGAPTPITDPKHQLPLREMLPTNDYPGILWVLDELHRLTTDDTLKTAKFAERLERIARIGRKYGIILLAGTQSLLIDDFGGGTVGSKLRAYLAARNNYAFYNANRSEQHVVAGLKIAPSTLPTGGGYAYSTGTGRLAMLRVAWAPDLSNWVSQLPTHTPTNQTGHQQAPVIGAQPDPDTRHVLDRHRPPEAGDPTALYSAAAEKLRALRAGQPTTPNNPNTTGADTATSPRPESAPAAAGDQPGGWFSPVLGRISVPTALSATNVIALPTHTPGHASTTSTAAGGRGAGGRGGVGLSGAQATVHDALSSLGTRQHASNAQLVDLTGLSGSVVSKALTALETRGLATKLRHGVWKPRTTTPTSSDDGAYDEDTATG